ncbi:MAG: tetratricopeptide repeat protein [Candidatus Rifleibacteriota bacterium]
MYIKSKETEELFDRGINYFRAGFYSAAIHEFKAVKTIEPDYPNIDYFLEAANKKNNEVAGKLANFIDENFDADIKELAEELTFDNSTHLGKEIESLLRQDKVHDALAKLQKAESVVPDSKPLLLLMANVQRRLGQLEEAEKTLQRALLIFPDDLEILNNLGNVYLARNYFKDAEETFRVALRANPDDPRVLNNFASLKMQMNMLDEAEKLLKKAQKIRPNWKKVASNLNNLRARMNALDQEIEALRKEFLNHPTYLDIGLALGKALFFRGYFSEAKSTLRNILKKNPNLIAAYFYMGMIHEMNEDFEDAIDCYREMVVKTGKDDRPEFLNFESLVKQEFYEEALAELKKIAILDLDLASSRINLGIKYFEDCQWSDALRHFEEAIKINDKYPDAFYWKALTLIQLNESAKARKNLEKALELNEEYADAHFQLGMLLRTRAKKKAKTHLEKALSLNLRPSFANVAKQILSSQK